MTDFDNANLGNEECRMKNAESSFIHHSSLIIHHSLMLCLLLALGAPTVDAQEANSETLIASAIQHQSLGLAYLEESQPSQAIAQFEALVQLLPDEAIGYANLAVAHLRLKQTEEAERWAKRGIEAEPMSSELHFILADVYQVQGRTEEAIAAVQEAVRLSPERLEPRYRLVRHYLGQRDDTKATDSAIDHLRVLREQTRTNIVVLLQLAQALLQRGGVEETKRIAQELEALLGDTEPDKLKFLQEGLRMMDAGEATGALRQMRIFGNLQRASPRYQQGIGELVTDILGHPIEAFSPGFKARLKARLSPPIAVQFVDVTEAVGLNGLEGKRVQVILTDYDNDGDLDLYTAPSRRNDARVDDLFRNDGGAFTPVARIAWYADGVAFADYDKDGDQDLFTQAGQAKFYRNEGDNTFVEFAESAGVVNDGGAGVWRFFDYDHDGDLDLYSATDVLQMYQNDGDGTFTSVGQQTFQPTNQSEAILPVIGDFDDDGDIDLLLAGKGCTLYTNLRQGRMQAIQDGLGIAQDRHFTAIAAGDYDNNGTLDVFLATDGEMPHLLYRNRGDGTFVLDTRSDELLRQGGRAQKAHFLDFDNDGFLDIWVIGDKVRLLRNDGTGKFTDASVSLPEHVGSASDGAFGDYDGDGDLDLFLVDTVGKIVALQNEGGNQNGWIQVRLEGVTAGNNKVNTDAIGSKVELKAGDLYQLRYVAEPLTYFGLGSRAQADVLRVVWTNGVPQNVILPKANQRIVEKQVLKGSCPFLYAYDGKSYQFVTDLLWRSPLGMTTPGGFLAAAETKDYVKIPEGMLQPKNGVYSVQITEELWEVAYFDLVKLVAVDHPAGTRIFVDEKYGPPPFPEFKLYAVREVYQPRSAHDHNGNDVTDALATFDYRYAVEHAPGPFQGVVEPHAIVLDLNNAPADQPITLFLTGWIFPTDTSINVALAQRNDIQPFFPYLQVLDESGEWKTVIDPIGIPAGKNKTIVVDLRDKFLSQQRQVKIVTNMQIYWDAAFFAVGDSSTVETRMTALSPQHADLHYRGFSEMYRPNPNAPHLFDYNKVSEAPQWRDMAGHYTRYGDVTSLLQAVDDMYVIMNAGDEMTVGFDADALPPLEDGWVRDFILFSDGWDKDADINTLFSQTVEPLPFHGMSAYPYPQTETYPSTSAHVRYQMEYNTRRVTHALPVLP